MLAVVPSSTDSTADQGSGHEKRNGQPVIVPSAAPAQAVVRRRTTRLKARVLIGGVESWSTGTAIVASVRIQFALVCSTAPEASRPSASASIPADCRLGAGDNRLYFIST